ncbi:hypothetical protein B0H14DRAFT_3666006 [Mycena olivaceomarginata]|nr:hypothetical protein B0H14DRAFT_3666006 [Mycena olivaceomarginata]
MESVARYILTPHVEPCTIATANLAAATSTNPRIHGNAPFVMGYRFTWENSMELTGGIFRYIRHQPRKAGQLYQVPINPSGPEVPSPGIRWVSNLRVECRVGANMCFLLLVIGNTADPETPLIGWFLEPTLHSTTQVPGLPVLLLLLRLLPDPSGLPR